MISLTNILTTSHYERKTLLRSWFFRIFFIIALLIIAMLNLVFFIIPVAAHWDYRALPANLPLINVLFVNVAQAVIAIFLASDFLKRDKKLDTSEVIYTRSISNNEYIIGKTWGVLSVFLGMTLVFLILSLVFNLILTDTPVNALAYIIYPLIISVPTLVFILGFSYVLMLLIKNQAVTFLVLVGYVALTLFYFGDKFYGMFDYMAFFTPMSFSEITGFAGLKMLLIHRLFYFLLGVSFIAATINRFSRLPNRLHGRSIYFILFLGYFMAGVGAGLYYWYESDNVFAKREIYLNLNNRYARHNTLNVADNRIAVTHRGETITVKAGLDGVKENKRGSDTLIFTLNPGLKLRTVTDANGKNYPFERDYQIIKVFTGDNKVEDDSLHLSFEYSGTIDETFCYLDIAWNEYTQNRSIGPVRIDKRVAFISRNFVMLTPETFWYPTPGVAYNVNTLKTRKGYFSDYTLTVKTYKNMSVLSQCKPVTEGSTELFKTVEPTKSLTLILGQFDSVSLTVDSITYNLFYKTGHDFFTDKLSHIKDTLASVIRAEKSRYDNSSFISKLPLSRLDIIEVPAHFQYYQRLLENTFETVQPGMILYPERGIGLNLIDFKRYARYSSSRNRGETVRPIDSEVNVFRRFIGRTFFSNIGISSTGGSRFFNETPISFNGVNYTLNPYSLYPMYITYNMGIQSANYPLLENIFTNYLRETNTFDYGAMRGGMREQERANLLLQENSLSEIIDNPDNKGIIPEVIIQKGSFLIYGLKHSAGVYAFDEFIRKLLTDYRFAMINDDTIRVRFLKEFDVDISPFLALVGNKGDVPAFKMGQTNLFETRDDIGSAYLVKFNVSNASEVEGILDINFRVSGSGFGSTNEERIYLFEPNETKSIQIMLYDMPRMMMINTIISKNIPASYNIFMRTAERNYRMFPEEYEETIDDEVSYSESNEYVVDNEDKGFSMVQQNTETKLKQYVNSLSNAEEDRYGSVNSYRAPHTWQSIAHTAFYGSVIKSAYYTRSGNGERTATWRTDLPSDGMYDVYVYIPRDAMVGRSQNDRNRSDGQRGGGGGGGGRGGDGPTFMDEGKDYQYYIYHGEEKEEIQYRLSNIENGWNKLGAFFFPQGETRIELTNKTSAERVFADAVKWVKRDQL